MSENKDIELLADIVRLLKKYGPKPFEDLARSLKEGHLLDDLVALLNASAQAGRRSKSPSEEKRTTTKEHSGVHELLRRCEAESPEKARALEQLHKKLVAKTVLPTLRDIRRFAEDSGLPPITATSREKAILLLLHSLASAPLDLIKSLVARASQMGEKGDRTLEGWTGIILGSRNKGSQGSQ